MPKTNCASSCKRKILGNPRKKYARPHPPLPSQLRPNGVWKRICPICESLVDENMQYKHKRTCMTVYHVSSSEDQYSSYAVGGVPLAIRLSVQAVAELNASGGQNTLRAEHPGEIHGLGYSNHAHDFYRLTKNRVNLIKSEHLIKDLREMHVASHRPEQLPEGKVTDLLGPKFFTSVNYCPFQVAPHHPPPPQVAQLLGGRSCKDDCADCKISCLSCKKCCVHTDRRDRKRTIGVLTQRQRVKTGSRAYFILGKRAFPITDGLAVNFDGRVLDCASRENLQYMTKKLRGLSSRIACMYLLLLLCLLFLSLLPSLLLLLCLLFLCLLPSLLLLLCLCLLCLEKNSSCSSAQCPAAIQGFPPTTCLVSKGKGKGNEMNKSNIETFELL